MEIRKILTANHVNILLSTLPWLHVQSHQTSLLADQVLLHTRHRNLDREVRAVVDVTLQQLGGH